MVKNLISNTTVDRTRRRLLQVLAANPFRADWACAPAPKNPDVVIIGAGAAGLGAAKTLSDLGISFLLIEAQSRIGGRAYTACLGCLGVFLILCCFFLYGQMTVGTFFALAQK
jgi:NADPH-dependent 2,4-dienoyl-CoA reductase/sulfur reductase-like enzyme